MYRARRRGSTRDRGLGRPASPSRGSWEQRALDTVGCGEDRRRIKRLARHPTEDLRVVSTERTVPSVSSFPPADTVTAAPLANPGAL